MKEKLEYLIYAFRYYSRKAAIPSILVVLLGLFLFYRFQEKRVVVPENVIDLNNKDVGVVVQETVSSLLSDEEVSKLALGDLVITPGDYSKSQEPTEPIGVGTVSSKKVSYKPGISWATGELTQDQLYTMAKVAASLYKDKNYDSSSVVIQVEYPYPEELEDFNIPIWYYVEGEYLTMNLKLTILDLGTKEQEVKLMPITVKYNIDTVEWVDR